MISFQGEPSCLKSLRLVYCRLLQKGGADLEYFSPMRCTQLPHGCTLLYFGGGTPEAFGSQLASNVALMLQVGWGAGAWVWCTCVAC